MLDRLRQKLPRLTNWILAALALVMLVLVFAPFQLPVTLYKLSLITIAALAGYWLDRACFPYSRPHFFISGWKPIEIKQCRLDRPPVIFDGYTIIFAVSMLRRALIVSAAMIAVCLGA